MDDKWKVSKKERGQSSSSQAWNCNEGNPLFARSASTSNSPLLRSLSHKTPSSSSNSKSSLPRSFSQKNSSSIGKKCTDLAKEHKARFYIIRRCVAMLVCWHKHRD
ncbi:small polypeptide DEVIL 13 [Prosopis cineraria]|uniref:small polypeptide DEVIL 13 n=1 Tax=Prosopis cineraria TaxID=364024 RepID=UPI00240EEFA0|nr:small polypeptide DEVIL 13 [Prosopis cineraria]XP_054814149.1 small polypeptide DEVIL 13 [Prosopis cineraria]